MTKTIDLNWTIEQDIYIYEDEQGKEVYDIEEMVRELEAKLKKLDPDIRWLQVVWS